MTTERLMQQLLFAADNIVGAKDRRGYRHWFYEQKLTGSI